MANKKVSADIVRTGIGGITIQGDMLYKGASDLERLPKGTAAQALIMNSGATAPEWGEAGGGKVLQCIAHYKTDTQSITGVTEVTVLTKAITPEATSSNVLVQVQINLTANVRYCGATLYRDSTKLNTGTSPGNYRKAVSVVSASNNAISDNDYIMRNSSMTFLDTVISTTSEVTYTVKCGLMYDTGSGVTYINRNPTDTDASYIPRAASSMVLTEIGA